MPLSTRLAYYYHRKKNPFAWGPLPTAGTICFKSNAPESVTVPTGGLTASHSPGTADYHREKNHTAPALLPAAGTVGFKSNAAESLTVPTRIASAPPSRLRRATIIAKRTKPHPHCRFRPVLSVSRAMPRSRAQYEQVTSACLPPTVSGTVIAKSNGRKGKGQKERDANDMRCSQAVTHPSTIRTLRCLTSVSGREPVYPAWCGRWREGEPRGTNPTYLPSFPRYRPCSSLQSVEGTDQRYCPTPPVPIERRETPQSVPPPLISEVAPQLACTPFFYFRREPPTSLPIVSADSRCSSQG